MAIKTITITEEAYESIKRLKSADESFSELFKRLSKEKTNISSFFGVIKKDAEKERKRIAKNRKLLDKDIDARLKNVSS